MNFSKWNKRITAWILLFTGLYMFLFGDYELLSCITVLGSGLGAIGIAVWGSIKNNKAPDEPPPILEEHIVTKQYNFGDYCIKDGVTYRNISIVGSLGEFDSNDWVAI